MRILHVVHQYAPEFIGGTELYTAMVARRQAALGHQVGVFSPSITADSSVEEGVQIFRIPCGQRSATKVLRDTIQGDRPLIAAWGQVLDEMQPEIVHIEHLMGLPASLIKQLHQRDIPYVVTLHDFWYGCANAQLLTNDSELLCEGPKYFLNCGRCALARVGLGGMALAPAVAPVLAYRQHLLRPVLSEAKRVIAPAAFVQKAYESMGFESENMMVIPHGIELPERLPQRMGKKRAEEVKVVYVGGISPQKGLHVLIEAFNQLPATAALTIYGDLDAFPLYVDGLRQLATHPNIRLAGRVSHDQVWPVLAEADLVAVPTQWYEAFGLIVSEAFAVATPVIASDIGVIGERIRHGIDGWLVAHDDVVAWAEALQMIINQPQLLLQWQHAIQPVWEAAEHIEALQGVYEAILNSQRQT